MRDLLTGGPTPSNTVKTDSREGGYSWSTVRRAADSIGVIRRKGGMDAGWYWSLPAAKVLTKNAKVLNLQDEHLRDRLSNFGPVEPRAMVLVEAAKRGWTAAERDACLADADHDPDAVIDVLRGMP